jgi:hypothetical protein
MPGNANPIAYRDSRGRVRYSVGVLSGAVYEVKNVTHMIAAPGYTIAAYRSVMLAREQGSCPPYFPAANDTRSITNPRPLIVPVQYMLPAGSGSDIPLGVALSDIPPGGTGMVAGVGCIVPTTIHKPALLNEAEGWVQEGPWVVCGDGLDGGGLKATPDVGRTLGFMASPLYGTPAEWFDPEALYLDPTNEVPLTFNGGDGEAYCLVAIHPQ